MASAKLTRTLQRIEATSPESVRIRPDRRLNPPPSAIQLANTPAGAGLTVCYASGCTFYPKDVANEQHGFGNIPGAGLTGAGNSGNSSSAQSLRPSRLKVVWRLSSSGEREEEEDEV